jgi:hypothetical protein
MPPETNGVTEMPRTKNTTRAPRATAPSAAHAAPAPGLAPGTGPAPDDPAAAVHAALTANPGATTTTVIAAAAGIGRPAARDVLTAMEAAGTVARTKGAKPGIPDTWTLTAARPARHEPSAGPGQDNEHAVTGQPGDHPANNQQDGSGQQEASLAQASTDGDPGPAADQASQPDGEPADREPAEGSPAEASRAEQDTAVSHEQTATSVGENTPADASPDPALVTEIAERVGQIQAAASAAATALASGGDLRAVQTGLDEIYEQAAQARRTVKAAAGGKKAPAARPGGLREKVLAHLRDHPDKSFTPHEIHKVIGHSSGAIANALDTLVKHGDAGLATEKPRRFRLASDAAAPAGTTPSAEPAAENTGADEETDLAGAA